MIKLFNSKASNSQEYLANEFARGYKVTQGFFIIVAVVIALFFIVKVLPTIL